MMSASGGIVIEITAVCMYNTKNNNVQSSAEEKVQKPKMQQKYFVKKNKK